MDSSPPGKVRNPGIVILLCVVTIGVYWFVWLYKAFTEFARERGKSLNTGGWVTFLAILWAAAIALGVAFVLLEPLDERPPPETPSEVLERAIDDALNPAPLQIAQMAATAVFFLVQLFFMRNAGRLLRGELQSAGLESQAGPTMAVIFNAFLVGAQAPLVGGLFGLPGIIIAIIWVVFAQRDLNRYWQNKGHGAPSQTPYASPSTTGGWPPAARQPSGQTAPARPTPGQAQERPREQIPRDERPVEEVVEIPAPKATREKAFACPSCRTHVRVNYVPGEATPVQCPNCGARGTVR